MRLSIDPLESRCLLTVTSNVVAGVLTISSDSADDIAVLATGGNVKISINGGAGQDPAANPVAASTITDILFENFTSSNDNLIDLRGVTPADFTALDTVSVDAGPNGVDGDLIVLGGTLQSFGSQLFVDAVELRAATTISSGGAVDFQSTVDSDSTAWALLLQVVNEARFGAAVGGANPLASLNTNVQGVMQIDGPEVTTTGNQNYNDPVVLGSNTVLSGVTISFSNTLDSDGTPRLLEINASGITSFNADVGGLSPLGAIQTDAAGTTFFTNVSITTVANQTYLDLVSLSGDAELNGATVSFELAVNSFNGEHSLTVNATSQTKFGATVGQTLALASLTTNAGGTTLIIGDVTTTGDQQYGDAVTLGSDVTLIGNGITFNGTLNSTGAARVLEINSTGETRFSGQVGAVLALKSLVTDSPGVTVIAGGFVGTTDGQTYNDAVVLTTNTDFSGPVKFNGPLQAPPPDNTNATWLKNLYFEALRRPVEDFGFVGWMGKLNSGVSRVDVAQGILGSTEYRGNLLAAWYQQYLGREIDLVGLAGWLTYLQNGSTTESALRQILASDDYFTANGGALDPVADALAADLWAAPIDDATIAGLNRQQIVDLVLANAQHDIRLINSLPGSVFSPFNLSVGDWFGRVLVRDATNNELAAFAGAIQGLTTGIRWNDAFALILASDENFNL